MAYLFTDADGDEAVHFERGKWDNMFGYWCPECGAHIGDPIKAMDHENELPCKDDPEHWNKVFYAG